MIVKESHTGLKAKWRRNAALLLSMLYLSNPLYPPISFVLHESMAFFESPNTVLAHDGEGFESIIGFEEHEHKTMQLDSGHEFLDLVGMVLETSEQKRPLDESFQDSMKVDKHMVAQDYQIGPGSSLTYANNYYFPEVKSQLGHPIKTKEPPQLS